MRLCSAAALLMLTVCDRHDSGRASDKTVASQPVVVGSKPVSSEAMTPKQMYVAYCSACHTLELVESQRLDRTNWEWVMDDVVNEYGGTWITEQEREILIDYLVENFGPAGDSGEAAP
ncbi:MAG: cytochrome c [Phycisphaerales bacterium]|nr:cytochrome c [Phycisphaerales bacterium]